MKKFIFLIGCIVWVCASPLYAQPGGDGSYVKLRIQKMNTKEAATEYAYSAASGASISLMQNPDGYHADLSFASDFPKRDGQSIWIQGICRITPPGTGKYLLRPYQGEDPPKMAEMSINIDNNIFPGDRKKGTSGAMTISLYPTVGGYIYGTFDAVLNDSEDEDKVGNLYKVSGEFKILRTQ